jgi:hypothetical protein
MNRTRLLAFFVAALLPLVLAACGNKGPLVQATPIPPTIGGTPTIEAGDETPSEGTRPPEEAVEDADPSDEIVLPEEAAPDAPLPPETEPVPEPAPEDVPPADDPNG